MALTSWTIRRAEAAALAALLGACSGSADRGRGDGGGGSADLGAASDGGAADAARPDDAGGDGGAARCPGAGEYLGDAAWPHQARVREGTALCSTFDEFRPLREDLARKAELRLAAGSFPLPDGGARLPFRLPMCLRTPAGGAVAAGAGVISANRFPVGGRERVTWRIAQPVTLDGEDLEIVADLSGYLDGPSALVDLHGDGALGDGLELAPDWRLCRAGDEACLDGPARRLDSCTYRLAPERVDAVTLAGGQARFMLRLGDSFAGTEPGAYVGAEGTWAGVAFRQTDPFRLPYHPYHHHFTRDFGVLFDEPIEGICGLEVLGLGDPTDGERGAYTVDCGFARVAAIEILDAR